MTLAVEVILINNALDNGKIDFIALKEDNKEYYQVCYYLADDTVINR